jgi:hypothetical protein
MTEIIKDMLDPLYFVTVFPVGMLYLGYYWRKDSKEIQEMRDDA